MKIIEPGHTEENPEAVVLDKDGNIFRAPPKKEPPPLLEIAIFRQGIWDRWVV